jgi:hypothetical protein
MARSRWGEGPIDIGGGGGGVRLPQLPSLPTGRIKAIAAIVGLLLLLVTGYYQIEPDAVGVVQRFGKYVMPHFTRHPAEAGAVVT